jgi:thiamine biosynthesis lipoprotein
VIHHDAGVADAAATALFVAGREKWKSIANNMGIQHVMLIDSDGNIHLSRSMQKRIKILDKSSTSRIIVSEAL